MRELPSARVDTSDLDLTMRASDFLSFASQVHIFSAVANTTSARAIAMIGSGSDRPIIAVRVRPPLESEACQCPTVSLRQLCADCLQFKADGEL